MWKIMVMIFDRLNLGVAHWRGKYNLNILSINLLYFYLIHWKIFQLKLEENEMFI